MLGVKGIMVNCGIPMVDTYNNCVSDTKFEKYINYY